MRHCIETLRFLEDAFLTDLAGLRGAPKGHHDADAQRRSSAGNASLLPLPMQLGTVEPRAATYRLAAPGRLDAAAPTPWLLALAGRPSASQAEMRVASGHRPCAHCPL